VILCFFGGFLLDRVFGVRLGSIIFCLFVLVGQLIFALGMIAAAQHRDELTEIINGVVQKLCRAHVIVLFE